MPERPKLGEILIEAGVIDELQLRSALGEQARWGRRLGVTLVKLGMVEERELVRALATQLDLPVASLAGKTIREDVLALVPTRVATEHSVVPLFTRGEGASRELFLGMEDPSNIDVLDDLSFRTGLEIRPVMVAPSEIGEAIDRYYLAGPRSAQSSPSTIGLPGVVAPTRAQAEPVSSDRPEPVALELEQVVPPSAPALEEELARLREAVRQDRAAWQALARLLVDKGLVSEAEVAAAVARVRSGPPG